MSNATIASALPDIKPQTTPNVMGTRKHNSLKRLRTQKHANSRNISHRNHPFPNAYYILGHGGNYDDRLSETVPTDCAVIAKALPGQMLAINIDENVPIYDTNQSPYINPFKKENLLYLVDKYKHLSMFGEGAHVPNFTYTLLEFFETEDGNSYKFTESGIIQFPFRSKDKFIDTHRTIRSFTIPKDAKLSDNIETLCNLYTHSIYPTAQNVRSYIEKILKHIPDSMNEFIQNIFTFSLFNVSQTDLFVKLPKGVYYNFVCRANEYTNKLYKDGQIIDESMRNAIVRSDPDTLYAREGLKRILSEVVGTRAAMIRRIYNNNVVSNSILPVLNINTNSYDKFRNIQSMIETLQSDFTTDKMLELINILIANADIFADSNYSIKAAIDYVGKKVPQLLEQLEPTEDNIRKAMELYNVFAITNDNKGIFKGYPSYLENFILSLLNFIHKTPSRQLLDELIKLPLYKLEFMHDIETNDTLLMILLPWGKFGVFNWLYQNYPTLARLVRYNNKVKRYITIYTTILDRYTSTNVPEDYEYSEAFEGMLRRTVENEKNHMDSPSLRSELAEETNQTEIIYKIFEPYILHYKLYEEFPTIRQGMTAFHMLPLEEPILATKGGSVKYSKTRRRRNKRGI